MRYLRPFIISGIIGILLLIVSRFRLLTPVQQLYGLIFPPVFASETAVARHSFNLISVIGSIKDLARENGELRAKNNELTAELAKYKEIEHENEILRQELNFTQDQTVPDSYIPARLIGRTPTGLIKDLIIDRGQRDGITAGQPVLAQGHLIGLVTEARDRQSIVRLLSHPQSFIPVITQESRSTGVLRGGISGLTVTDILVDAPVKPAESVLTSGLGGIVPADIPIGKVIETISHKGDITKRATVSVSVDITKLEVIFVRKEAGEKKPEKAERK